MGRSICMIFAVFFPVLCGAGILISPNRGERKKLLRATAAGLAVTAFFAVCVILGGDMELTFLRASRLRI